MKSDLYFMQLQKLIYKFRFVEISVNMKALLKVSVSCKNYKIRFVKLKNFVRKGCHIIMISRCYNIAK